MEMSVKKTNGLTQYKRNKFNTINKGMKRRAEVKREFQDYLNGSCSKYESEVKS